MTPRTGGPLMAGATGCRPCGTPTGPRRGLELDLVLSCAFALACDLLFAAALFSP